MTTVSWQGPGGSTSAPTSGDFESEANWSGGGVPGANDAAVLGSGSYTVTSEGNAQGTAIDLGSLVVGKGATLALNPFSDGSPDQISLSNNSGNHGTIAIDDSSLEDQAYFTNDGIIEFSGTSTIGANKLINTGLITAYSSSNITFDSPVANDGTILAANGSIFDLNNGDFQNLGLLSATDGSIAVIANNLANGVLTGGSYSASAASSIQFDQEAITELANATHVTQSGYGAIIESVDTTASTATRLNQSLANIDSGATLTLLDDTFAASNAIALNGTLILGSETYTGGDLDGTGTVRGSGEIDSSIVGAHGTASTLNVAANGGTLVLAGNNDFSGVLSGTGTLDFSAGTDVIDSGARLSASTATISGASVALDENLTFNHQLILTSGSLDLGGHALSVSKAVDLSGGSITGGGTLDLKSATLTSDGTTSVAPDVTNSGAVVVTAGTLDIEGQVNGTGSLSIGSGATLQFDAKVFKTQAVDFTGQNASLTLTDAHEFGATVSGLQSGDAFDLTTFAASTATFSVNSRTDVLHVRSGAQSASIYLGGSYSASQFTLGTDSHGGTMVTYGAAQA